jgi:hypothetical protein
MKEKLKTKYIQKNWRSRIQNKMSVKYTKSSRRKKLWKHKKYPSPNPMSCKEGNQNSRSMKRIYH